MINITYIKQPDNNSCALACYAMVTKYFFPKVSFNKIAKISNWQPGYTIWAFRFWLWIMNEGISVEEYCTMDYKIWAEQGLEGLEKTVSKKDFGFYQKNTKDLASYSADISAVLEHPNFHFFRQKPTFSTLEKSVNEGKVCEVVLDSRTLRKRLGYSLHRVVILGLDGNSVTFHDPAYYASYKSDKRLFARSWLEAVDDPELCVYERKEF